LVQISLHRVDLVPITINRIQGKVAYVRPPKQQASLKDHDLGRSHELVGVGQHFGKVSVLAIMSSKNYEKKHEYTSNADRLKFIGRFGQINIGFIGQAIVAFVRR